jgi:hypothetical protein
MPSSSRWSNTSAGAMAHLPGRDALVLLDAHLHGFLLIVRRV